MDSKPKPPKKIIESAIFTKNRDILCKNIVEYDDLSYGVTFAIACKPSEFPIADPFSEIRVAKTDGYGNTPALTIYFKEYEEEIILLDVEVTKD